jgi:hypothetical protein
MARGAGVAILTIGVFAALNQLKIAPAIVNGLFYAMLAIIVGAAVISVGVGGIPTMRRYWERSATRLEGKAAEVKEKAGSPREMRDERTLDLTRDEEREQAMGTPRS